MEWRNIKGFDNYMISSCGVVKSVQRVINRFNGRDVAPPFGKCSM